MTDGLADIDHDVWQDNEKNLIIEEQVRLLYKNASVTMISSLVNPPVIAFLFWGVVGRASLIAWVTGVMLVTLIRYADVFSYRRSVADPSLTCRRLRRFTVGAGLSGIAWGLSAVLIFPAESLVHQTVLAFVHGGMLIGAAGTYAPVRKSFFAFSIPGSLPIVIRFLAMGDIVHVGMGGMALLFVILISGIAVHIHKMNAESLAVRFANKNLISYLELAKENAEELARDLSQEIEMRKKTEEELQHHREHLEELVGERSAELVSANDRLKNEIAERLKAEKALARSEEYFRSLIEHSLDVIAVIDRGGRILYESPSIERLMGYTPEELRGRVVFDIVHEDDRQIAAEALDKVVQNPGNVDSLVARIRHRNGSWRLFEIIGKGIADDAGTVTVIINSRDITERKKMEQELIRAQKLESIGVLAGGIAHDFNNLLTAIMGNVTLAKMQVTPGDKIFQRLTKVEEASLRAKDLSRQLLTFSRGGKPIKKMASLETLLRETAYAALKGTAAAVEFSIPDGLWPAEVDEGQIRQLFHNLLVNAEQAMPQGGSIMICCENVHIRPDDMLPLLPGRHVKITVEDQGIGIPQENLNRIFDPYFTTKKKGSGLGLASVYSIARRHNGHIAVESEGGGSRFHVLLPAPEKTAPVRNGEEGLCRGGGRVLLMDDEEAIRDVTQEMLREDGHTVVVTEEGEKAIAVYQNALAAGEPFDVVILDLTVPGGMGGLETIRRLLEIDPKVKAIVSSGYSDDQVMADHRRYGFMGVLTKPFEITGLARKVREVMPSSSGAA